MSKWFQRFALLSADVVGRPVAFLLACLTILVWGGLGPIMKFSDTWQLIISTRRIGTRARSGSSSTNCSALPKARGQKSRLALCAIKVQSEAKLSPC